MQPQSNRLPVIIQQEHTEITELSATFDKGITLGEWQQIGAKFNACSDGLKFWIGDWFNHGMEHFHSHAQRSLELVGLDATMVRECALVAKRIGPARRSAKLSYGHHQVIAAEAKPSHQLELLKLAEERKLTVPQLRRHIRHRYAEVSPKQDERGEGLVILAELSRWERWEKQQDFSAWTAEQKTKTRAELQPLLHRLYNLWERLGA